MSGTPFIQQKTCWVFRENITQRQPVQKSQLDKKRLFKHLVLIRESNRRELTGFVPRVPIQLITIATGFDRYLSDRLLYSSKKLRGTYFTRAAEDNLIFKYLIKVLLLFGSEGWFRKFQRKPRTPRYSWHRTKLDPVKCKRKFTQNFGQRNNFHLEMKPSREKEDPFISLETDAIRRHTCTEFRSLTPRTKVEQNKTVGSLLCLSLIFKSCLHESSREFPCVNFVYGISFSTAHIWYCLFRYFEYIFFFSTKNLLL